ncbi:MAG: peptide chain release factor N(5)-glutamine methyltransferase [Planctomycetaceae bacterium]|jgi:release factor glutamine methyltransferase|nr:peptide chain release factor N(5)-glutamine methyltransferase [Planctomycetaceae bacterium]
MSEQTEKWTVGRLLGWTSEFFKSKGLDSPLLDAQVLLAGAMGIKRIELYTNFSSEPTEQQRAAFRGLVKRRGAGEPAAYLVGNKEFYSITFKVNANVLIPRPETEQLVLEALDKLKILANNCNDNSNAQDNKESQNKISFCDVGTGSGVIAVAVTKNFPRGLGSLLVTAIDISPEALSVAELNAGLAGVRGSIDFVQSDLLDNIDQKFDIIASNPPYVSISEYENLPRDVKDYEPKLALLAGETGAEVIAKLASQAKTKIKSGGYFLLEISPMIVANVEKILSGDGWENIQILHNGRIACCEWNREGVSKNQL